MRESSSVRCVLFDAVGTLIYPAPPVAAAYGSVGRKHGSWLSDAQIEDRFRQAFCRQEELDSQSHGTATDETRERCRWETIVAEVFDDLPDTTAVFSQLWRHFADPGNWRLYDDVPQVWQALTQREVTLGVASNFDRRLRHVCAGLPPLDRCQRIFVSSELTARKPATSFFRQIEQALSMRPQEILLVGDDWTNDYLAARNAGWRSLFLDRCGQRQAGTEQIASLRELPPLLDQRS